MCFSCELGRYLPENWNLVVMPIISINIFPDSSIKEKFPPHLFLRKFQQIIIFILVLLAVSNNNNPNVQPGDIIYSSPLYSPKKQ